MNELLHTILLRVTLAGAASAAALRMAGSGAMRETVRLAAGLLMLAALLQPLGSLRSAGWSASAAPDTQAIRETNMQTAMSAVASSIAKALESRAAARRARAVFPYSSRDHLLPFRRDAAFARHKLLYLPEMRNIVRTAVHGHAVYL